MNCRKVYDLLPLYADGELQGAERERVEQHLQGCAECRERLALDGQLAAQMGAWCKTQGQPVRPALRRKVMAQVEQERRRRNWWRAAGTAGHAAAWITVSAVTVLLLVGLSLSWKPLIQDRLHPAGTTTAGSPATANAATPLPSAVAQPGLGWQIVRDDVISAPYYWIIDGERVDRAPQISPDGSKMAYLPTEGGKTTDIDRLVVRDLITGKDLDLTPEAGYSYTSVRWSPDGKVLAFVKHRYVEGQATATEVWRIDADGRNLKLIYHPVPDTQSMRGPAVALGSWSADGKYISFGPTIWGQGTAARVGYRIDAVNGGEQSQAQPAPAWFGVSENNLVGGITYAPGGEYALCAVKTAGLAQPPKGAPVEGQALVLYDLAEKRATVLGAFDGGITVDGISPSGQWISFSTLVRSTNGPPADQARTWVVRRDGTGLREVTLDGKSLNHGDGPVWANVGRAYYNAFPLDSSSYMIEMDAASGQAAKIDMSRTAGRWTALASVSNDGRRLLVVLGEWENASLHLLELAPKANPAPTVTPANVRAPFPSFGTAVRLLDLVPTLGQNFRLSPDGRWVAYVAPEQVVEGRPLPRRLVARSLENGQTVTLLDEPSEAPCVWLPDSRRVLAITGGAARDLVVKTVGPEPAQRVATMPAGSLGIGEAVASPDGARVAYTVAYPDNPAPVAPNGVFVVALNGGEAQQIVAPDYYIGHLAWSADGGQVLYFKGKGGTPPEDGATYVVPVAGGVPAPVIARARLAGWSPDGSLGLWLGEPADAQGNADLWAAPLATNAPSTLQAQAVDAQGAAWLSNNAAAFSQHGGLYMLAVNGRPEPIQLSPRGERATAPQWVPDRGLFYVAQPGNDTVPSLWLLPLANAAAATATPVVPMKTPTPVVLVATPTPVAPQPTPTAQPANAVQVRMGFYSGMPDPQWYLNPAQAAALARLLDGLSQANIALGASATINPGYSGFRLQRLDAGVNLPEQIWAFRGLVLAQSGASSATYVDPQNTVERFLLETGKATLKAGEYGAVNDTIGKDNLSGEKERPSLGWLRMSDALYGWAVVDGSLARTVDGAQTWTRVPVPGISAPIPGPAEVNGGELGLEFRDVNVVTLALRGPADGTYTIVHTADGGRTWKNATVYTKCMSPQISFADGQHGWVMFRCGVGAGSEVVDIINTDDGGATWTLLAGSDPDKGSGQSFRTTGLKSGLTRKDADTGWAGLTTYATGKASLYVTHDGGRTWAEQAVEVPAAYKDAQSRTLAPVFANDKDGALLVEFLGTTNQLLPYVTHDGGATWQPMTALPHAGAATLVFGWTGAQDGWVAPLGTAVPVNQPFYRTTDGGQTWQPVVPDASLQAMSQFELLARQAGFAVSYGDAGVLVFRTEDGGTKWITLTPVLLQ